MSLTLRTTFYHHIFNKIVILSTFLTIFLTFVMIKTKNNMNYDGKLIESGTEQEIKTKNVLKSRKYYHLYVNVLIVHNKYYFCPSDK